MTPAPDDEAEVINRLPFQVRPKAGEGVRGFVARLAQANFLPPAYLRRYLSEPPDFRSFPAWTRVAGATGRDADRLRQILQTRICQECAGPMLPKTGFGTPLRKTCSSVCRQKAYRRRYPRPVQAQLPCRVCGKAMKAQFGQRRLACSSACRQAAFRARHNKAPVGADPKTSPPARPKPVLPAVTAGACAVCAEPIDPESAANGRLTCSNSCRQKAYRQRRASKAAD